MDGKFLGKITKCKFGLGGRQDAMIGVSFVFQFDGICSVSDFWGAWAIPRSDYAKWSEQDRIDELGKTCMRLTDVLNQAKKESVSDLVGVPVEITISGQTLKSWRVLTEVI